jgi:hypothetical protein
LTACTSKAAAAVLVLEPDDVVFTEVTT